jgi:hypothetical protein
MRQITYKLAKKQLVGDGHYVDITTKDYDLLVDMFMGIGDLMSQPLDTETRNNFDRYLDKNITYGNKGKQTRRDFILGIIKQKGIERKDFSTRQLENVAEIYNTFCTIFDQEPIELVDHEELTQARADRYNRIFEQVNRQ